MSTPGGPLITVADMLHDLSADSSLESGAHNLLSASAIPYSTPKPTSGLAMQGLPTSFEETYNQLNLALKQSGHSWTGLTQELCATLTTADKLVTTAHSNLGQLTQEVKRLEEILQKGQDAVVKLQASLDQNTDAPLPGEEHIQS